MALAAARLHVAAKHPADKDVYSGRTNELKDAARTGSFDLPPF